MEASWIFGKVRGVSKQRDPIQAEFFNSAEEIRSIRQAFIRESIQNVLDQADPPAGSVTVRILLAKGENALEPRRTEKYFRGLWQHLVASDKVHIEQNMRCAYIVFEDFGTTGLTGNPATQNEPPPNETETNDFLYFFRREGKSGKKGIGGKRGSWGIGKYVFPMSSEIWTFFGYTIRKNDHYDDGAGLLFGQSTLINHSMNDEQFEPDGWWGVADQPGDLVKPFTDPTLIQDFKSTWNIARQDEPGLSLVIPYVSSDFTLQSLLMDVLDEYFATILTGRLIVDLQELGAPVMHIDAASILERANDLEDGLVAEDLRKNIALFKWAQDVEPISMDVDSATAPKWSKVSVTDDQVSAIRQSLDLHSNAAIRVPVKVTSSDGSWQQSHFDVLISEELDLRARAIYIRNGLIIPEAKRDAIRGFRAIVFCEDKGIADLLGKAEGPAHVNWNAQTAGFKGKYQGGPEMLTFVRQAPHQLVRSIVGQDEEQDFSIAAEFFPISSADASNRKLTEANETLTGQTQEGGPIRAKDESVIDPPPPAAKSVILRESNDGGFKVDINSKNPPQQFILDVAYSVRRGDAFKKWSADDFVLTTAGRSTVTFASESSRNQPVIKSIGCVVTTDSNTIEVTNIDPENFSLSIMGFDTNRDVTARVRTAS